jgi:DNA repair protein RecN (Recombination protein N)
LLDALGLLLGDRAEGSLVREGAERAEISAEFDSRQRPEIKAWLQENALSGDDDIVLIRRVLDKSGRSRSFINGQPATLAQLKLLGEFWSTSTASTPTSRW